MVRCWLSGKRAALLTCTSTDRLVLYSVENDGEPLFFQHYDSKYVPTLRLLHKCKLPHTNAA